MTKDKYPDRIPFDNWINSQLSIAKHYGQIQLNGDLYVLDYNNCKFEIDKEGKKKFFPDLVKKNSMEKEND